MDQPIHAEIVPYQQTALSKATSMEATIAAAVESQTRAVVQARYALAIRNPRDIDVFRSKILKECKRPGFADVARYAKKQGKKKDPETGKNVDNYVIGPSIRFAEAALRCFTNVLEEEAVIHDDDERRVMRVSATDLESNLTYSSDIVILKQVERRFTDGREPISSRKNSYGDVTHTLWATDEEALQKQASMISKALRKQVLRMLPGDIVEECMNQVVATQSAKDKADPDAQRKSLFDGFGTFGVSPADIKEYLDHEVGLEDLPILRAIFQTLKQGEARWSEIVAEKRAASTDGTPAAAPLAEKLKAKAEKLDKDKKKDEATAEQILIWQSHLQEPTDPAALDAAWSKVKTQPMSKQQQDEFSRLYITRCDAFRSGAA